MSYNCFAHFDLTKIRIGESGLCVENESFVCVWSVDW